MLGKIERFVDGQLVGWLWDERAAAERVTFDLLVNGSVVGRYQAAALRGDLQKKGIGDGRHAFAVPVQPSVLKAGANLFVAVAQPSRQTVAAQIELSPSRDGRGAPALAAPANAIVVPPQRPNGLAAAAPVPAVAAPAAAPAAAPKAAPPPVIATPPGLSSSPSVVPAVTLVRPRTKKEAPFQTRLNRDAVAEVLAHVLALAKPAEKQIAPLIEAPFKLQDWDTVTLICDNLPAGFPVSGRILTWHGRALIYTDQFERARVVLERVRKLEPAKHGQIFYLGIALARLQLWRDAAEVFRFCLDKKDSESKYHLEYARALIQIGFGSYGAVIEDRSVLDRAVEHLATAATLDKANSRASRELAALLVFFGRTEDAIVAAKQGVERAPKDATAHADLARILVRANRIREAFQAAEKALELDPRGDGTKFNHRLIARLAESVGDDAGDDVLMLARQSPAGDLLPATVSSVVLEDGMTAAAAIRTAKARWVALPDAGHPGELVELAERAGFAWAAGVRRRDGEPPVLWRREYLAVLIGAGIIDAGAEPETIAAIAGRHGQFSSAEPDGPADLSAAIPPGSGVLLVSQFGARKFGGAEHFLEQMAHLYQALGFKPLIVGTREEHVGEEGDLDGIPFTFVDGSAEALVALAIDHGARLVHVVSGLGYEVAAAFRFLDVRTVFGVHFWREAFQHPTPSAGYFPDIDREATPRREFHAMLADFDAVYSNSQYTSRIIEQNFSARTPVIYSLPDDLDPPPGSIDPDGRDIVLLANARADKGFDLFVEVASKLPKIRFVAIISQSSAAAARALVARFDAGNVELIDRVSDMAALYAQARVVAVPSYRFIETFSRVVIEAHRYGIPVVGSDRGNVPHLLVESGGSLPEDAALWAKEIERLCKDDAHWRRRSRAALENSRRYAFTMQQERLSRLVTGLHAPLLVGVGSGLGNIIHAAPLIRNLARRLGRPVDVVMAGDYREMLFLLGNSEYVRHGFTIGDAALNRRYDAVFLTHCFGTLPMKFASSRIYESRRWDNFHAGHELHEAEFNLAAAEALLGVPYDADDVRGYFVGDIRYTRPAEPLVGFHAGSKGGIWASKRWPRYSELARQLAARGVKVASFGTSDEYVEGTIDMTGGTIEEMTRKMLACSHFVANDSGVMNIANALGIPLTALFAPTNVRTRGPLMPTSRSIAVQRDCAPCELDTRKQHSVFVNGGCQCISMVESSIVLNSVIGAA